MVFQFKRKSVSVRFPMEGHIYLSCHKGSEKPPLKVCLFPRPLNEGGLFDPLIPMSDSHLISPCNVTPESHVKVTRIKEMITN